jgi:hypothetical protein
MCKGHYLATAVSLPPQFLLWAHTPPNCLFRELCTARSSIFPDITPCSSFKVISSLDGTRRLHLQGQISQARNQGEAGSKQAYSSTLKMEEARSSETLIDFQRTTWRYIRKDRTLHNLRSENLKCCIIKRDFYSSNHFNCLYFSNP